jgi:hypothetical protein
MAAAVAALAVRVQLGRRLLRVMVAAGELGSMASPTPAAVEALAEGRRLTAAQAEAAVAVPVAPAMPELPAKQTQGPAVAVEWQALAAAQAAAVS